VVGKNKALSSNPSTAKKPTKQTKNKTPLDYQYTVLKNEVWESKTGPF
jgi:hypothetical protein